MRTKGKRSGSLKTAFFKSPEKVVLQDTAEPKARLDPVTLKVK
jgi:hypothetical protein